MSLDAVAQGDPTSVFRESRNNVSDADATTVVLNRFKATKLRARAEVQGSGVGTIFENGEETFSDRISFARVPRSWLLLGL